MTPGADDSSLQLEQDEGAQRAEWRFERAGWIAIALLVLAGALGAFGQGPLSQRHAATSDARLSIGYDRVAHHDTPTDLVVTVAAGSPSDSIVTLYIDRDFLDGADLERVRPDPAAMLAAGDEMEFRFRRTGPSLPMRAVFTITPNTLGRRRATVRGAGARLSLSQIVLP